MAKDVGQARHGGGDVDEHGDAVLQVAPAQAHTAQHTARTAAGVRWRVREGAKGRVAVAASLACLWPCSWNWPLGSALPGPLTAPSALPLYVKPKRQALSLDPKP